MAGAGVAIGADGTIVEMNPRPARAVSDGAESLDIPQFHKMILDLEPYIGLWRTAREAEMPRAFRSSGTGTEALHCAVLRERYPVEEPRRSIAVSVCSDGF